MGKENIRERVAREAALLIYYGLAQEYKQAKERAAKALGARSLPSNLDVALELDRLIDEMEGLARSDMMLRLRKEALQIMEALQGFHPRLIGSVWRGTARRGSDIDILTFSAHPEVVLGKLRNSGYKVLRSEWRSKDYEDGARSYFHIYLALPSGDEAEVVVRSLEDLRRQERCDIYGDMIVGLSVSQLRGVLDKNPLQKFVPKEK